MKNLTKRADEVLDDDAVANLLKRPHEIDVPFSDIPAGVWRAFLAIWVGFFATLWWIFGGAADSAFMVGIATVFGLVFFTVPLVMCASAPRKARLPKVVVETLTGPLTLRDATAQILLVPLAVTLGLIGMGIFAI